MEDDAQNGPFTVWQMFNTPTMVLFNNLENAVDGLERILMSILKSSGDFSEVLVARPGSSRCADEYYKSFNTWLIGRLFYVWSVDNLNRIHISSKDAQIKILNILCINGASFYEQLHQEYIDVLLELIDYFKENTLSTDAKEITLKHFVSKQINVPDVQLNLEPIFVKVSSTAVCKGLINMTLQLLAKTMPMDIFNMDKNIPQYKNIFSKIIFILESFDMDFKLFSINFFASIIKNCNDVAINRFDYTFPSTNMNIINSIEVFIASVQIYYESGEINDLYLEKLNKGLLSLLQAINYGAQYKQSMANIVSTILKINKIFSNELRIHLLRLSSKIQLPNDIISLENLHFTEIETIADYCVNNILEVMNNAEEYGSIKENYSYKQCMNVLSSLEVDDHNKDLYLITYHIKRCSNVLQILQRVHIIFTAKMRKQTINLISKEESLTLLNLIIKIFSVYKNLVLNEADCIKHINDIVVAIIIMHDSEKQFEDKIFDITLLQTVNKLDNDIAIVTMKYLMLDMILFKFKTNAGWNKSIMALMDSLLKNKTTNMYKQIIPLSPLLLISNTLLPSKLISDVLMPAFLMKEPDLQIILSEILPIVTCISLGNCAVILKAEKDNGYTLTINNMTNILIVCSKCHNASDLKADDFLNNIKTENVVLEVQCTGATNTNTVSAQRSLFAKFLKQSTYPDSKKFTKIVECFSNHTILNNNIVAEIFHDNNLEQALPIIRVFIDNIQADENLESSKKEVMFNICINLLVNSTKTSLLNNEYNQQSLTLNSIRDFGLSKNMKVLLPSTKLLVYFIMHPQCSLGAKAVVYLRDVCEGHNFTPNQVYHRYKKDYCKLFVDCCLYNGRHFSFYLLKVVRAFGFVGYRDFISKDVHHFLPYLIPYSVKTKDVLIIIEEIASLVQCSVSDFLIERFPHVYTHVYLHENDSVAKKCYSFIENLTKMSVLNLIKRHFRVILTEFLLQYCFNPDKVLNACRYLASNDPDESIPSGNIKMSTTQIADFLQPKFLGVLAYFDHKLVNSKVALSVKRKALQSFPHIIKLIGVKHLTKLRFKVLATLRSALSLAKEFPKILAAAWSAFISNIDTMHLGPLLPNLAVSLLQQYEYAPHEINKIFQYLVSNNENLLSSHIPDLFFLDETNISENVKLVIKKHVDSTMPDAFLDKVKWYLQYLNKDIPNIKVYAFTSLDRLMRENRTEIHKAIFGGKNIDPVIVELIECLLLGCKNPDKQVRISSGACLGELGALEAGHLPRQYVQPDRSPFAFTIVEDCFATTALVELTRACQYEKDTMNVHCYALTIQEILKSYNISPTGDKKQLWDSFPEHMHQIMDPLLRSRYTLACPSQPKKTHPLFGSTHAATFLEWAHNWTGQLIPLMEKEDVKELLRTVHPSMRRDVRTLFLFLPYVLLHAIMSRTNAQYIQEEILAVIGLESFHNENRVNFERNKYKLLRHIRVTPSISSTEAEECNQIKCCKMIYTLLDFLNRWLLECLHVKHNPSVNEDYKSITLFLEKFDKLTIAKGNFFCGENERALQYLEMYMEESKDQMQTQLPFLAEIYAVLDEPDSVAGILSMQRSEPSLKELILAQIVTGRLQDAALCYERLAQEGHLDRHGLQGMIECYLGLDQPFTAYRLLNELEVGDENMMELAAEPLWRLGRFEQLDELVKTPVPPSRENWGLVMGRILLSYRSQDRDAFDVSCKEGMSRLLSQMEGEGKTESALRNDYQTVFGLHIIKEATHVNSMLHRLKRLPDGHREGAEILNQLVEEWRRRAAIVQSDVRSMEPLLRCRRILLLQTQEMLKNTHPFTAEKLRSCIGDLWLQSAKHARKAGIFQQAYMYILNAEDYHPEELFIEKAKMYWERKQSEHAFTTLRRGLEEAYPQIDNLSQDQKKICAKAKLLIAKYNDETTNVDVDVNIGYYKEAVDVFKQWEKSLVSLGAYYEKVSGGDNNSVTLTRRVYALNSYGKALQYGHKYLYQSMPRMLSIWLGDEMNSKENNIQTVLIQMTEIIKTYSERLPLYLYLTAFSQIVSRICHPVKEVYQQLKAIIVKLILAYPQHTLWMMMCVIKSSYPQRFKRCQDVLSDPRLREPNISKLINDFTQLAEKLIELCNKPTGNNASTTTVSSLVRTLPRLLAGENFSHIMIPFQEFCKIVLPSKAAREERLDFNIPTQPPVYIAGIEEHITILPSLQKPRKVTLQGSDGKSYIIMLKPRDDLRKDYRLMEFNGVVNRFLQDAPETRKRRLYIRTYCVLPLNEECGLIEWVPNLLGLRPIVTHIYKQRGISTSNRELKDMMSNNRDPVEKKRKIYLEKLIPRHPPVFQLWFRRVFTDPYGWYQARSAYIRTTAVISMVGYILGLGDRHGENISFDSTNGDTVHVDFNCLFNKGEAFEWPERVPFRLTHNMEAAMGPLKHEGKFRKSCEAVMRALREQTAALMSVIGPFVYDPLVSWGRSRPTDYGERTNEQALQHLLHIRQRLNGMVRTKNKQLSLSLSPEGQVEHLIVEATSIDNLCQMYMGWGAFL